MRFVIILIKFLCMYVCMYVTEIKNIKKQESRVVAKKTARCSVIACSQWLFDCYFHSLHKSRCESETI